MEKFLRKLIECLLVILVGYILWIIFQIGLIPYVLTIPLSFLIGYYFGDQIKPIFVKIVKWIYAKFTGIDVEEF